MIGGGEEGAVSGIGRRNRHALGMQGLRARQPGPGDQVIVGRAQDARVRAGHHGMAGAPVRAGGDRPERGGRCVGIAIPSAAFSQCDEEAVLCRSVEMIPGHRQPVDRALDVRRNGIRHVAAADRQQPQDAVVGRQQQRILERLQDVVDLDAGQAQHEGPGQPAVGRTPQIGRAQAIELGGEGGPIGGKEAGKGSDEGGPGEHLRPGVAPVGRAVEGTVARRGQQRAFGSEGGRQAHEAHVIHGGIVARPGQPAVQPLPGVASVAAAQQAGLCGGESRAVGDKGGGDRQVEDGQVVPGWAAEKRRPGSAAVGGAGDAVTAADAAHAWTPAAGQCQAIGAKVRGKGQRLHVPAVGAAAAPVTQPRFGLLWAGERIPGSGTRCLQSLAPGTQAQPSQAQSQDKQEQDTGFHRTLLDSP